MTSHADRMTCQAYLARWKSRWLLVTTNKLRIKPNAKRQRLHSSWNYKGDGWEKRAMQCLKKSNTHTHTHTHKLAGSPNQHTHKHQSDRNGSAELSTRLNQQPTRNVPSPLFHGRQGHKDSLIWQPNVCLTLFWSNVCLQMQNSFSGLWCQKKRYVRLVQSKTVSPFCFHGWLEVKPCVPNRV